MKTKIEALIRASEAERVAVAYRDLQTGASLFIHPDARFHAASTMKVPVMMEVYRQAHAGLLSLDDHVSITNRFISLADGSPYTLSPDDDGDPALYERIGQTVSVRDLVYRMITLSGNLATNTLMEHVTAARINASSACPRPRSRPRSRCPPASRRRPSPPDRCRPAACARQPGGCRG